MAETILNSNQVNSPNTYWFNNRTGTSLSTGLTISNANSVSVYKNGVLLKPGQARINYNFTGASGAYVGLTQIAPLNTANSWCYKARFLTSSSRDNYGVFFGMAGSSDWQAPLICYDTNYDRLYVALSSNGTSWNLYQNYTNIYLDNNKTYDIEYGFTGTQYYVKTKLATDLDYTMGWTYSSSTKTVSNQPLQLLNNFDGTGHYNGATLYMKYTKIIIDDVTWFDGESAILGTDYINSGCTAEEVNTTTNDYTFDTTTGTIYFADDLINDNIIVQVGGVGSAPSILMPTTTWYNGTIGTTLDTMQSLTGKNVEVFKNGLLLRPGQSFTNYKFTGGQGKWVNLANTIQLNTANSWYYLARFTLPASRSNRAASGEFFGFSSQTDSQAPLFGYRRADADDLKIALSSNGSSWDIGLININYNLDDYGETYDIKLGYESNQFYVDIKKPAQPSYDRIWSLSSSTKAYAGAPLQFMNSQDEKYGADWLEATLWMQYTKVVVDGVTQFNGSNAVIGTDYINHNCTQTSVSTCTNDYCVSDTTLIFSEDLVGTDVIMVKVY